MYSEDSEDHDFNTMDRQKQEALLKKTWMERERQFYGDEIDEDIIQEQEDEDDVSSEEDDVLDRDDTIKAVQGILDQHDALNRDSRVISENGRDNRPLGGSHFQVMRAKQLEKSELQIQLKHK